MDLGSHWNCLCIAVSKLRLRSMCTWEAGCLVLVSKLRELAPVMGSGEDLGCHQGKTEALAWSSLSTGLTGESSYLHRRKDVRQMCRGLAHKGILIRVMADLWDGRDIKTIEKRSGSHLV